MNDPAHLRPSRPDQPVVLVADDEPVVCNLVRIALEDAGFFVLAACDGDQALLLSRTFPGAISALVSDVQMPNMGGVALRRQILQERSDIKVLLMSGHAPEPIPGVPFLRKPFHLDELQERVRQLLRPVSAAG